MQKFVEQNRNQPFIYYKYKYAEVNKFLVLNILFLWPLI